MTQPLSGNLSAWALRQPLVVLPSQSRRQPAAFSCAVRVLSAWAAAAPVPRDSEVQHALDSQAQEPQVYWGGDAAPLLKPVPGASPP